MCHITIELTFEQVEFTSVCLQVRQLTPTQSVLGSRVADSHRSRVADSPRSVRARVLLLKLHFALLGVNIFE